MTAAHTFTNRYAQLVHVVIATTGFAFGDPQPTGSHWTPVGRTATIRRRLTGQPRFDFPSQTCPAAGLVTDTGHLLHIPEDFTIRFWIPRGRVNAPAARFPASDFLCGQNVARTNVERLDDPAAIAVMPAVDSPDVSCCLEQFGFCHNFPQCSHEQRNPQPRLLCRFSFHHTRAAIRLPARQPIDRLHVLLWPFLPRRHYVDHLRLC